MNTVPRPALPVADYYVDLKWPDVLGGDTETRGPLESYREARLTVAAARASLGPSAWPSVAIRRVERPR